MRSSMLGLSFALVLGACANEPNQRSGLNSGCSGSAKSSAACQGLGTTTQANAGDPNKQPDTTTTTNTDDALKNLGESLKGGKVAVGNGNPTQPTNDNANQPNPLGGLIDLATDTLSNVIAGNGGGNGGSGGGGGGGGSGNGSTPSGQMPSSTTSSSVSLVALSGTYFKKSIAMVTNSMVNGVDYCLLSSGLNFTAQCVSSYNNEYYTIKSTPACANIPSGLVLKNSVRVSGTISSSCP